MNQQHRLEYWQAFDRFRRSREVMYAPKFAWALREQKKQFIEQFKQGNTNNIQIDFTPVNYVMRKLYFDAGVTFGRKVLTNINQQRVGKKHFITNYSVKRIVDPNFIGRQTIGFNARMQQLIEQYYGVDFLNMSVGITDTTRQLLLDVLTKAQKEGKGFDDIVQMLEDTELSKARSRLIARTETVTAANSGAHLSAKESGILVNKVWIATQDARTRHDHYFVSSDAIDIDSPFQVGAYEMMHPGIRKQPNGLPVPPKEVCNCRCVEAFVPVRDAAGRVMTN